MSSLIECNICFKRGDGEWAGWHKQYIGHNDFTLIYGKDDEPPSKSNKDNFKLCLSGGWDLYSAVAGCQPLLAGVGGFRSLAWFGNH